MALHTVFGAGPIGRSLTKQLLKDGHQVRLVSRRGTSVEGALALSVDAGIASEAVKAADGAAAVYNCTNVPYPQWTSALPNLFKSILLGAEANQARLVLLDNLYTYFPIEGPIREGSTEKPPGKKGRLRLQLAEGYLEAHRSGKVEVAIARASDFYGPEMTNVHLGERVFKPLIQGKAVQWIGNPDALHSFAYREDVAKALAILGTAPRATGRVWIVPHAPPRSPRAMLEVASKIINMPAKIQPLKAGTLSALGLFMPMMREMKEMVYQFEAPFTVDSTAFETTFGQKPTSVEDGIRKTLEALRESSIPSP